MLLFLLKIQKSKMDNQIKNNVKINYNKTMRKINSKQDMKIIHAKLISSNSNNAHSNLSINTATINNMSDVAVGVRTPSNHNHKVGLIERVMNIVSPATTGRKHANSAQRKIVSIDLKIEKKSSDNHDQSKPKKIVLMRRKTTQSADRYTQRSSQKASTSLCGSQKRLQSCQSTQRIHPKLKCFDEMITAPLEFQLRQNTAREQNWDELVQNKKQQLYSQLYKMDKKIFSLQRDLDSMAQLSDKRSIIEMVKRKTCQTKQNAIAPIHIHTNIYKMGKHRAGYQ